MPDINYKEENIVDIQHLISSNIVLLITATSIESAETHKAMKPFPEYESIVKVYAGALTLYLGTFGLYRVAHLQCSMGSQGRDSSIITIKEALGIVNTKVVVMPGIAFGRDAATQKVGDVLLAEAIQPYNNKRVGEIEVQRGIALQTSRHLLNRFKSVAGWEFYTDKNSKSELITGVVLSGEELIDNIIHRDQLFNQFPNAKGGEMEGAGLYAACDGNVNCILIKGICDFADGEKGKNKAENQIIGINAALSYCMEVFNSPSALTYFDINSLESTKEISPIYEPTTNFTLFEIYNSSNEPYYVEREIDNSFRTISKQFCIWVYGISGCGKSTLISRNLDVSKVSFIQVNLASCVSTAVEDFFIEIFYDLVGTLEGTLSESKPNSFQDCSKQIISLLEKHCLNKSMVVFIEEIPLDDFKTYKEFAQRMFALLVMKSYRPGLENVRFILSSINDPMVHVQNFNQKIHVQLKFLQMTNWSMEDIAKLWVLINTELKLKISETNRDTVLAKSNGSPRFVKKFFRNLLAINKYDDTTILNAVSETDRELNNHG